MRRILSYLLVLTIPLALFGAIWQSQRFDSLMKETLALETKEESMVEDMKRQIAGIAALSAPKRIDEICSDDLKLEKRKPLAVLDVTVQKPSEEGTGG